MIRIFVFEFLFVNLLNFYFIFIRLASIRDKSYKQAIVEKDPMKKKELYVFFQSDRNTFHKKKEIRIL